MAIGRPLEESRAQALLELTQAADHRGLPEAERPSGPSEAAGLGDGENDSQVVSLHARQLSNFARRHSLRIRSGAIRGWRLPPARRPWWTHLQEDTHN